MNKFFIFTLIILVSVAHSKFLEKKLSEEKFMKFISQFNKQYNSIEETAYRFSVFLENLKKVEELNKANPSANFAINQFADLLSEEMVAKYSSQNHLPQSNSSKISQNTRNLQQLPNNFNWKDSGKVNSVRYALSCLSSYAIAAAGVMEGQYARQKDILFQFSDKQLIDCDSANQGCEGGSPLNSFAYLKKNKIQTVGSYSNSDKNECRYNSQAGLANVQDIFQVEQDVELIRQTLVSVGPLATAIDASSDIQLYQSGVFEKKSSGQAATHHLLLVGYGDDQQGGHWILKNSWSPAWGESGYIRISRNILKDCGVSANVSYATISISED